MIARSPTRPLHRRLQQFRCLHDCSDCYRVERTSSRVGFAPTVDQRLSRRTVIVDMVGKGGRLRTVPVPAWCKGLIDVWIHDTGVNDGKVFRRVTKDGTRQEEGVTTDVVWYAMKRYANRIGIDRLAPHDLRRTCARLCHEAGGELEQIQFLLGHASVQTTERYIGCRQNLREAVNDRFRISPSNKLLTKSRVVV
jgi:integrase